MFHYYIKFANCIGSSNRNSNTRRERHNSKFIRIWFTLLYYFLKVLRRHRSPRRSLQWLRCRCLVSYVGSPPASPSSYNIHTQASQTSTNTAVGAPRLWSRRQWQEVVGRRGPCREIRFACNEATLSHYAINFGVNCMWMYVVVCLINLQIKFVKIYRILYLLIIEKLLRYCYKLISYLFIKYSLYKHQITNYSRVLRVAGALS